MPAWLRNPWVLAFGAAVLLGLLITAIFSRDSRGAGVREEQAIATWKARTGVDLAALPRLHPATPDSEEALALDALLDPDGLQLSLRRRKDHHVDAAAEDQRALYALREAMRAAMRAESADSKPLAPEVVALIERRAATLDRVAEYVATHTAIRWQEDFQTHPRMVRYRLEDHLTLHRLLIGRAFAALDRNDIDTAQRMLATSQALHRVLETRNDLSSQSLATGIERMHLALLRRARGTLGTAIAAPDAGIRERYRIAISSEAATLLALATQQTLRSQGDDPAESVVLAVAGPEFQQAAAEAVALTSAGVGEILKSQDECLELTKRRRHLEGWFAGDFATLDANDAWRLFVLLQFDRAMTAGVLTGRTSSPCPSVTVSVEEHDALRTVRISGLPPEPDDVVALPRAVTTRLEPRNASAVR